MTVQSLGIYFEKHNLISICLLFQKETNEGVFLFHGFFPPLIRFIFVNREKSGSLFTRNVF